MIFAIFIFSIYYLTAYRSITWWHGCSYPTTAITFGVYFPPGSLILTILGWLVAQLPLGISKAFTLNLLAGFIATFACLMVMKLTWMLFQYNGATNDAGQNIKLNILTILGVAPVCLMLAFAETTWHHAIQFTPYILTMAFTAILLWAILNWWNKKDSDSSYFRLFIVMLIFGLDFSVHRANLLLLPGFLIWVMICRPRVFTRIKSWLYGAVGLIIGFAFHLLIIPIAARHPIINANNPDNWSRFYDYVSLKQYGGGWLVNLWPRKGPFFDHQLADYLNTFADNFVSYGSILAFLPLLLGLAGIVMLWNRNWRVTLGLLIFFICASLGAVVYFNLPANFYWPMDRHYLPSFLIFTIFAAYAAGLIMYYIWKAVERYRIIVLSMALLLVLSLPVKQIMRNFNELNASKRYFAYDYGRNVLKHLQPNAIIFLEGEKYWPPLYLQAVEKVRPDVTILSPSLSNTQWYVRQVLSQNENFPIAFTEDELINFGPKSWHDTTIAIIVEGTIETYQLPDSAIMPDTFYLNVKPTVADHYLLGQDQFLVKLIEGNRWQRPIYFINSPAWLKHFTRNEGLVSLLVPQENVAINYELLRENLLERYSYRGYNDPSISLDKLTKSGGYELYGAFFTLAQHELDGGNKDGARQIIQKMTELLPVDRLDPPPQYLRTIDQMNQAE